jgi:hypothetical protein
MKDEMDAWRLWCLMQTVSAALWDYHEEAFLKFCVKSEKDNQHIGKRSYSEPKGSDVPF